MGAVENLGAGDRADETGGDPYFFLVPKEVFTLGRPKTESPFWYLPSFFKASIRSSRVQTFLERCSFTLDTRLLWIDTIMFLTVD
jgi:hypothetical protein